MRGQEGGSFSEGKNSCIRGKNIECGIKFVKRCMKSQSKIDTKREAKKIKFTTDI